MVSYFISLSFFSSPFFLVSVIILIYLYASSSSFSLSLFSLLFSSLHTISLESLFSVSENPLYSLSLMHLLVLSLFCVTATAAAARFTIYNTRHSENGREAA